jgi:hypothetical protein
MGKPEIRRLLRRPGHRWEDNIKKDLKAIEREDIDWIELAQNMDSSLALVSMVMNFWVP